MKKDRVHLRIIPCGFDTPGREILVPANIRLGDLVHRFCAGGESAIVPKGILNGAEIVPEECLEIIVRPDSHLTLHVVPLGTAQGPVSKETMRLLGAVGFELAGLAVPALLGLGGIQEYAVRAGITLLGILAVNTLIPILEDAEEVNVNYSGTRNAFRAGGRVPLPYGKTLYAPPLAAKPYTEVRGGRLYLKVLYAIGYRPVKAHLNSMRIGDNHIREYPALRYNVIDGYTRVRSVRARTEFEIYNDAASVEELVLDDELKYPGRTAAPWGRIVRTVFQHHVETLIYTTKDNTQQFSLDLTFPAGLHGSSPNVPASIRVQIQYQLDSGTMTNDDWTSVVSDEHVMYTTNRIDEVTDENIFTWLDATNTQALVLLDRLLTFPINQWSTQPGITDALDGVANDIADMVAQVELEETLSTSQTATLALLLRRVERLRNSVRNCRSSWAQYGIAGVTPQFGSVLTSIHGLLGIVPILLRLQYMLYMDVPSAEIEQSDEYSRFTEMRQLRTDIFGVIHTGEIIISNATKEPTRYTFGTRVPKGRYRVRVRKVTENVRIEDGEEVQAEGYQDQVYVTAFRSIVQSRPINENVVNDLSFLEMEIPVTDTVNGSLNEVTLLLETPLQYSEDGETWLPRATTDSLGRSVSRNPAWVYVDMLVGNGTMSPATLDQIDLGRIYEWAEYCYSTGMYFDKVIDNDDMLDAALDLVCSHGKAMRAMRDGLYSVAIDKPQDTLSMVITPYTSRDFNFTKSMMPVPHALNIQFRNPKKDWATDNIYVYNDGYGRAGDISKVARRCTAEADGTIRLPFKVVNLTEIYDHTADTALDLSTVTLSIGRDSTILDIAGDFVVERSRYTVKATVLAKPPTLVENIAFSGMIDVPEDPAHQYFTGQVERMGKYLLRCIVHRPEVFTVEMDYESLIGEAGDRVTLQHDVVAWGLGSGRLISTNKTGSDVNYIVVDQRIGLADGPYGIKVRKSDNSVWGPYDVTLDNDYPDRFTLVTPTAEGTPALAWGDLVVWGERRSVSIDCIIRKVHPRRFQEQQVTLVEASPQVHAGDDEPVGDYNPNLTFPRRPELKKPPKPVITDVITNESALVRDADGSIRLGILVRFQLANTATLEEQFSQSEVDAIDVQYQVSRPIRPNGTVDMTPAWVGAGKFDAGAGQVHILGVSQNGRYNVRIRSLGRNGVLSDWDSVYNVLVEGTIAPPPDVSPGTIRMEGPTIVWDYTPPLDFKGFEVRLSNGLNVVWAEMTSVGGLLGDARYTPNNIDIGQFTFGVCAVDVAGNRSVHPAVVVLNTLTQALGFITTSEIDGEEAVPPPMAWSPNEVGMTFNTGTKHLEDDGQSADASTQKMWPLLEMPAFGSSDLTNLAFARRRNECYFWEGFTVGSNPYGAGNGTYRSWFVVTDEEKTPYYQLQKKLVNVNLWFASDEDLIWKDSDDADFWSALEDWGPWVGPQKLSTGEQWNFRAWFPERDAPNTARTTVKELYRYSHAPHKSEVVTITTDTSGEYELVHGVDYFTEFLSIAGVELVPIVDPSDDTRVRVLESIPQLSNPTLTVFTHDGTGSAVPSIEVRVTLRGF